VGGGVAQSQNLRRMRNLLSDGELEKVDAIAGNLKRMV
jgi:hypothetical protein